MQYENLKFENTDWLLERFYYCQAGHKFCWVGIHRE